MYFRIIKFKNIKYLGYKYIKKCMYFRIMNF